MEGVKILNYYSYIKDYDGGTLMEAYVNPDINYSEISNIIKKQNDFLKKQILSRLNVCDRYKFSDLEKILRKNQDENNSKNKISENLFNLIPGIKENNWEYTDYMNLINNSNSNLNFLSQCRNVINKLKTYKNSWPFHNPVDVKDVPDYYDVIKEPMGKSLILIFNLDLKTLEQNLEAGSYKTKDEFVKDIFKIINNAKTYNKPFTIYHKYAKELECLIENDVKNIKESI